MSKVSVIIATYNGEQFVESQLLSLIRQSCSADEVLISDDCSTDNTVQIVKNFIKEHQLNGWIVKENSSNQGWEKNFYSLLFSATGDIIFYCDQDDVWFDNKIEVMKSIMSSNREILCLACHYHSIDQHNKNIQFTVDDKASETGDLSKINADDKRFYYVPSGCTIAFNRELLKYVNREFTQCGPDRVLCRTAILLNGLYDLDMTLMNHRFHDHNVSNDIDKLKCLHGSSSLTLRQKYVNDDIAGLESFSSLMKSITTGHYDFSQLNRIISFEKKRYRLLKDRNVFLFLKLLIECGDFYAAFLVITDFCYAIGVNKTAGRLYKLFAH